MIVLVATIGVAQLAQAVTLALPDYRTGTLQTAYPSPITGEWHPGGGHHASAAPQLLVLIVVPLITLGLWWLLGHTASARRCARRRPTPTSPGSPASARS